MTTTAPNRGDGTKATGNGKRPERPLPAKRERFDRTSRSKLVMLLNVVLIAGVAVIGLTQLRSDETPDEAVGYGPDRGSRLDAVRPRRGAEPGSDVGADGAPPGTPPPASPAPNGGVVVAPRIKPTMRSNFANGDSWPVGAGFRETGRLAWPLGVVDRLMTHGQPEAPDAVSWLEKWLKSDVRTIGARVLFAPNHSGSAAITAWHTSVLDTAGLQQPRTGMRLTVQPGAWQPGRPRQQRPVDVERGHLPAGGPLGVVQPGPPRQHHLGDRPDRSRHPRRRPPDRHAVRPLGLVGAPGGQGREPARRVPGDLGRLRVARRIRGSEPGAADPEDVACSRGRLGWFRPPPRPRPLRR